MSDNGTVFQERARLGGYREFGVPHDLRGLAAALWSYSRPVGAPPIAGEGHRLLPDTDLSIALWTQRDGRGETLDARLVLIGPIATASFFAPAEGLHVDAVRIHPEWARDVLGVDPREAVDAVLPFDELSSRRLPRLLRKLAASARPLAELAAEVRAMSGDASREARITGAALRRLRSSTSRLASIAGALDVSERHLRRLIRQTAGFGPKHLQRIARLGRAITLADRQSRPDWASIAADSGYCDQPHMIDDFRTLAGCTPAELFSERLLQRMAEISNPS